MINIPPVQPGIVTPERPSGLILPDAFSRIEAYAPEVEVKDPNNVEADPLFVTEWEKNTIMNASGLALSALFKGEAGYAGFQYIAVGGGQGSWDIDGLPAEDKERTQLYNEIARVAVVMNYLDESNEPTLTVTRHIDLAATFGSGVGEAASWREWAVFGGNATGSANSGIIIDLRLHTALPKVSQTWVRRTRFFF